MVRRQPLSTRTGTRFPYTTLFRAFVAERLAEGTAEFVTRTAVTVIAPWTGTKPGFDTAATCETAWHVQPRVGGGAGFMAGCQATAFDRFRAAGAISVSASNLLFGALPQALVLISWPDSDTRARGIAQMAAEEMDAALIDAPPDRKSTRLNSSH